MKTWFCIFGSILVFICCNSLLIHYQHAIQRDEVGSQLLKSGEKLIKTVYSQCEYVSRIITSQGTNFNF